MTESQSQLPGSTDSEASTEDGTLPFSSRAPSSAPSQGQPKPHSLAPGSSPRPGVAVAADRALLPSPSHPLLQESGTATKTRSNFGQYELSESLGRGGMGEVFLATAVDGDGARRLVVIKLLRTDANSPPDHVAMFLDEARLSLRIHHPNVVSTFDVGRDEDQLFIAMEYLEGQSLFRVQAARRATGRRLPSAMACRIVADALAGLHHAHELDADDGRPLGVVHRDVAPQNIFVTYDGKTKILDFGMAKGGAQQDTKAGIIKGRVGYYAPEYVIGVPIDRRADVYAAGIVLWELLTGSILPRDGNPVTALVSLLSDPVPPLSSVAPGTDPRLEAIVAKAVARQAGDRFQTAQAMRQELEAYLAAAAGPWHEAEVGAWMASTFADERATARARDESLLGPPGQNGAAAVGPAGGGRLRPPGAPPPLRSLSKLEGFFGRLARPDAAPQDLRALRIRSLAAAAAGVFVVTSAGLGIMHLAGVGGRSLDRPGAAATAHLPTSPSTSILPVDHSAESAGAARARGPMGYAPPRGEVFVPAAPDAGSALLPPSPSAGPLPDQSPDNRDRAGRGTPRAKLHHASGKKAAANPPSEVTPPQLGTGFLSLETTPRVNVTLNNQVIGTTPLIHVVIPTGSYSVSLDNDQLGIHRKVPLVVVPGKTIRRRLVLR